MAAHDKPILVFQTDFTYAEGAVSSMYGVVKSVDRELEIFDGTHYIPRYDAWSASYRLYQSLPFWPEGTIYVSVVDPGVGTPRRACVARTASGHYVVTPDNGALTHLVRHVGIVEVREIDETVNRNPNTRGTSVFHGRDLFGYCAARLASGIITYEQVGPAYPVDEIVCLPMPEPTIEDGALTGIVDIIDPNFGNAWTNIPLALFEQAGKQASAQNFGRWFAAESKAVQDQLLRENPQLKNIWDEKYGDRTNRLVFIGQHMDKKKIIAAMDNCLEKE